jgi:hypothetical protein
MGYELEAFSEIGLDEALLGALLERHERETAPRLATLWSYYRNRAEGAGVSRGRLPQVKGLPERLRGARRFSDSGRDDREVVIENDIAWRVQTGIDFLAGSPVRVVGEGAEGARREAIERAAEGVLAASGGLCMVQDMALLGSVYGHADLVVRSGADGVRLELVEAPRVIAVLDPGDYRRWLAAVLVWEQEVPAPDERGGVRRIRGVEILGSTVRQLYVDERLVEETANPLGRVPVAHAQNASEPFAHGGVSDVEPLIPLQDELNTRLSDRAHRVTLQSFRMYLAKGIEGFAEGGSASVGPGRVWSTDNPDASIESFGGDAASPSEESHIREIREAMDKTSGVTPVAAGVLSGKIGQLSSANALRVALIGLLAKTARKREAYGRALSSALEMALQLMHIEGRFETRPEERRVRIEWPDALPGDLSARLEAAETKRRLGVPRESVLEELGYPDADGAD